DIASTTDGSSSTIKIRNMLHTSKRSNHYGHYGSSAASLGKIEPRSFTEHQFQTLIHIPEPEGDDIRVDRPRQTLQKLLELLITHADTVILDNDAALLPASFAFNRDMAPSVLRLDAVYDCILDDRLQDEPRNFKCLHGGGNVDAVRNAVRA